ncbi:MAG: DUF5711 family protein [Clostridia bacterium]|nr:DUF5711 family protein [Clostridia bacterium]
MSLPEENMKTERAASKASIIMFFLLLAMIFAVAVLVYLQSQDVDIKSIKAEEVLKKIFSAANEKSDGEKSIEIPYDDKEGCVFTTYKDQIIKCSRNGIRGLDRNGNEVWSVYASMNSPRIKAGPDLVAYDAGGRELYVLSGKTVKWSRKLDNNIISADISESGHVSVIQEFKGYKGAVTIFNLQGNEFFTRTYAENHVLSSRVSPDGKYVLVNLVDTSDIHAGTSVEITDMLGKPNAAKILRPGELLPVFGFLGHESIMYAGDNMVMCIDKAGKEKWTQEFPGRNVFSARTALGKYVFLAVSKEGKPGVFGSSSTEVRVLNSDGRQAAIFNIQGSAKNIRTYGDLAAVNTGREVYFADTRGRLTGKYTSKSDINDVHFLNKQEAVVITKSTIAVVKTAHDMK